MATTICPQCGTHARVVEPFAFGIDRLRSSLSCGHVVARELVTFQAGAVA